MVVVDEPDNRPEPTPALMMYDEFESYQSLLALFSLMAYNGLAPHITANTSGNVNATSAVKGLFEIYAHKNMSDEQAKGFAPFFILMVFNKLSDDGERDNQTEELNALYESKDFWDTAGAMFDHYVSIEPYLIKEYDKLHELDNAITLNDLKALIFPYRDLPEDELERLFEICRNGERVWHGVHGTYSALNEHFENIYKAVKAARQALEKTSKPAKPKKKKTQPKPKKQTFDEIQAKGLEKQEALNAGYIPSSSGIDLLYRILTAGKSGFGELQERLEKQSKGKKGVVINRNGQTREITQITSKGQDTIIFDIEHLLESRQNSPARKILLYSLSQILQQALSNNNVIRDGVIISYQDMVDKRMYGDKKAAKRGLDRAFDLLSSIKVKGYITRGKGKIEQVKASVLFYDLEHTGKGSAILQINDTLNWGYIVQQYAMLPDAYYELPPNAADLYYYIFNQVRINIKQVMENDGRRNISYKAIHNLLGLPTIEAATNPTTQIKNPIENAIGAIADSKQDALYIEATTQTEYNSIYEYLEKGYITVVINPDYLTDYMKKVKEWEKANLEAKKRRMKIEDTAKAKALQKKIEEAETDTQK